jgi:hypothetical protein
VRRVCNAVLPGFLYRIDKRLTETQAIKEHSEKVLAVSAAMVWYPKCKLAVAALWDKTFIQPMLAHYPGDKRQQDIIRLTMTIK